MILLYLAVGLFGAAIVALWWAVRIIAEAVEALQTEALQRQARGDR